LSLLDNFYIFVNMKNVEKFFDTRTPLKKLIDTIQYSTKKWTFIVSEIFKKFFRKLLWWL
jgi:hypothetical protein